MRPQEAIEAEAYRRVDALSRDADSLRPAIRNWYEASRRVPAGGHEPSPEIAGLEPLLLQAMRPFLARGGDAIMARTLFHGWPHSHGPACGGAAGVSGLTRAHDAVRCDFGFATRVRGSQIT